MSGLKVEGDANLAQTLLTGLARTAPGSNSAASAA